MNGNHEINILLNAEYVFLGGKKEDLYIAYSLIGKIENNSKTKSSFINELKFCRCKQTSKGIQLCK